MKYEPHPVFNTENPPEEVHPEDNWVHKLVHDEEFNSAVKKVCEDTEYIYRKLGSLEDNDPAREQLEDILSGRMSSEWPDGMDAPTDFKGFIDQTAEVYNQGSSAINELEVNYGVAGLTTVAAVGLAVTGVIAPFVGLAALGAVSGATVLTSAAGGSIHAVNEKVDLMKDLSRCIAMAREDLDLNWTRLVGEDQDQEPDQVSEA